jgi:hypothetical protein
LLCCGLSLQEVGAVIFYFPNQIVFYMYDIQHCFICRPSDSTVSEDAGIEPRTVASTALTVRRSNHSARSHPNQIYAGLCRWHGVARDSGGHLLNFPNQILCICGALLCRWRGVSRDSGGLLFYFPNQMRCIVVLVAWRCKR